MADCCTHTRNVHGKQQSGWRFLSRDCAESGSTQCFFPREVSSRSRIDGCISIIQHYLFISGYSTYCPYQVEVEVEVEVQVEVEIAVVVEGELAEGSNMF